MMNNTLYTTLLLLFFQFTLNAQSNNGLPMIGAQMIIEPGQSDEEIDQLFALMESTGMTVCRIRMFESYLKNEKDDWDFTLFDKAFDSAQKHNVKIFATLFPSTSVDDIGGVKLPSSEEQLLQIEEYMKHVVAHYKSHSQLFAWVLINEPGVGDLPKDDFTQKRYQEWKSKRSITAFEEKFMSPQAFLTDYNTWFLNWIASKVRSIDQKTALHVNNHMAFQLVREYDFPKWSEFLNSLGASAHPSWHYGWFSREDYTMAFSANCKLIQSGAIKNNFWITELQGGTNIYSGYFPLCPTKEEISLWLWTGIGTGAEGIIFWSFNSRKSGIEAGEWGLVNYENGMTDRLEEVQKINQFLKSNEKFFRDKKVVESNISILYNRESMWAEKALQTWQGPTTGRDYGSTMLSSIEFYKFLQNEGYQPNLKELREFDFSKNNYDGQLIILSHQVVMTDQMIKNLRGFIEKGGQVLIDGLTGIYDAQLNFEPTSDFKLQLLTGGEILEIKHLPSNTQFDIHENIVSTGFMTEIKNKSAHEIYKNNSKIVGLKNSIGKGTVTWIPSPLALENKNSKGNLKNLWDDLEMDQQFASNKILECDKEGLIHHTLKSKNQWLHIINNPTKTSIDITLKGADIKQLNDGVPKKVDQKIKIGVESTIILIQKRKSL
ncbi:beta-galactosidase [Flammeovirga yaeyamensis]|uniref:beta-galactosidase n=1 Tax=Flammeovirga yaeyamensis TaxID=367791 RepID=A0AAX1NDW9_9BACT|nr:beta-galactosidase [Flammeovirga yaeyamensis]MBB3699304.1 beta-galactosidase [Flammeovirga yaeyamensis]NMF35433.1 hypothetical protein [Flammeovirga yaeyamensis]QWG04293.1 beta-galactosidase [Flammeovirga yaeyamensis]